MSGSLHFDLDGEQAGKRARVCLVLPDRTLHVVGLMLSIGWNNVRWGGYRENLSNYLQKAEHPYPTTVDSENLVL